MSEFWVSKKRYWCKYCGISIADDAPSRQHHESGLRHKGNVDKYIRDIYKTSEKKKKDAAEEEREMRRIDAAAREAFAKDVGSGAAAASSSSAPVAPVSRPAASSKPPPPKPTDKFANYSTAESLGFVDEAVLEAERRRTEGIAGNWELVLPSNTPTPAPKQDENAKRGLQPAQTEEKAAAESSRNFRVGERKVGAGLEEIWEPDIPIKVKVKSEERSVSVEEQQQLQGVKPKVEIDFGLPKATEVPVWKAKGWSKPSEVKQEVKQEVKTEESSESSLTEAAPSTTEATPAATESAPPPSPPPVKNEPAEPTLDEVAPPSNGGGMFRKRKTPPTTAGTRGVKKR